MKMPGLVPSPRHLGGRCLLLASLTGSERRGNSVEDAQPRAVAPSSRRTLSPARIPDWELVSVFFSICLCSTMPAPVPNGTLSLQTSPVLGLPLVESRPHYLVPGVWCGRGVSVAHFPTHPLPQNGNFDEKDEKNDDKKNTALRILVPRGPQGSIPPVPETPLALR